MSMTAIVFQYVSLVVVDSVLYFTFIPPSSFPGATKALSITLLSTDRHNSVLFLFFLLLPPYRPTHERRCIHNANPLTWSNAVASSAAVHAETLMGSCGELFHSTSQGRNGYGENLHMCWGTDSCYSAKKAMVGLCKCWGGVNSITQKDSL